MGQTYSNQSRTHVANGSDKDIFVSTTTKKMDRLEGETLIRAGQYLAFWSCAVETLYISIRIAEEPSIVIA